MRRVIISSIVSALLFAALGCTQTNEFKSAEPQSSQATRDLLWQTKYKSGDALPPAVDKTQEEACAVGYDKKTFFGLKKLDGKFQIEGLVGANINPPHPDLWPCISEYGVSREVEEEFFSKMTPEERAIIKSTENY